MVNGCALAAVCFAAVSAVGLLAFPWILQSKVDGLAYWGPKELACKEGDLSCSALRTESHYCERVIWSQYMRTPVNTFSNIMYCLSGVLVLTQTVLSLSRPDGEAQQINNHFRRCPALSLTYGIFLVFGGFGSFFCHASVTHKSREWDRAGIWAMFAPILVFSVLRFFPPPSRHSSPPKRESGMIKSNSYNDVAQREETLTLRMIFGGGRKLYIITVALIWGSVTMATLLHVLAGDTEVSTPIIYMGIPAAVGVILLLMAIRPFAQKVCCCQPLRHLPRLKSKYWLLAIALPCFAVGFVFQSPDRVGACQPDGPWYIHTHGYWHILTGIGFYLTWYFTWTENELSDLDQELPSHNLGQVANV